LLPIVKYKKIRLTVFASDAEFYREEAHALREFIRTSTMHR